MQRELARLRTDTGLFLDKGNQVFDVRHPDFGNGGARGDGVVDDTLALQAAIDAAGGTLGQSSDPVGSATIHLPPGNFFYTQPLELWSHQTLQGSGMGTTLTYEGTGYAIRTRSNARFVNLRDFQLMGNDNTTATGGILIGNRPGDDSGTHAYSELSNISIRGFHGTDAIGLHLANANHMNLSNVSAFSILEGVALQLTSDVVASGLISLNGCKWGEFNTTDRALIMESSGPGRLDDFVFNANFFGGTNTTAIMQLLGNTGTPGSDKVTDEWRNHHNISFNGGHSESGSSSSLGDVMLVESAVGLIIDGFQMQVGNHLAGADSLSAIKFTNTKGAIKDVHIRGWYAPDNPVGPAIIDTDWSGSGAYENINIEQPSVRGDEASVAALVDPDESEHQDVIEIPNRPRVKTNFIKNSDFTSWSLNSTSAPDWWTTTTDGTGSVALSSGANNFKIEGASAQIKMASGTFFGLTHSVDEFQFFKSKTVTLNGWYRTDLTDALAVLDDGVSDFASLALNSDNSWHWFKLSGVLASNATALSAKFTVGSTSSDGLRIDGVALTAGKQGVQHWFPNAFFDRRLLQRVFTWDPGSLVDGAGETINIDLRGAAFGDMVTVGAPYDLQDLTISAYVQAASKVEVRLQNESTNTVDLGNSAAWVVRVWKQLSV